MKRKKKSVIRKLSRFHAILTLILLMAYVAIGSAINPVFLISDFQEKTAWAASSISLTQRIFGLPDKPEISAETGCNGAHARVILDWNDDEDATAFDAYRGGEELVTDLNASYYVDNNVKNETSYEYSVTARGPAGENASDTLEITTGICKEALAAPVARITAFKGRSISGVPETSDLTPDFSGTANIANAIITINIHSKIEISSQTAANENGYWSWVCPEELNYGSHVIYVTAVDPGDNSRTASYSLNFKIYEKSSGEDDDSNDKEENNKKAAQSKAPSLIAESQANEPPSNLEGNAPAEMQKPFDMAIDIPQEALSRDKLEVKINVDNAKGGISDGKAEFHYFLVDKDDRTIQEWVDTRNLKEENQFIKEIMLPELVKGDYKVKVNVLVPTFSISADKNLKVLGFPVFKLGDKIITYEQIMENFSWLVSLSSVVLIGCFIVLIFEHFFSKTALVQITEKELAKRGFISRRKGVSE